jgi:cullin-associated NEDD8-dissociated protein 1
MLVEMVGNKSGKQVISNLAECIATIAAASTATKQNSFIKSTIRAIEESGDNNSQTTQLNLLVSGDFGRKVDLSSMPGVAEGVQEVYNQSFNSSNEDIKHAAALALGRASVGAIDAFLPVILKALEQSRGKKQYLLLTSLREFIHCYRETEGSDLSTSVSLILPHLEKNCENDEEGVRSMVAECLGSLACLEPAMILPVLKELATKETPKKVAVRWTVGSAVKFAIGGHISPTELAPFMPTFLGLLQEDDLGVKNIALLMVYSAVHHTPQLVVGLMREQILPQIYELAQLNMERKIDLGPFKHTVDDALPLRKAALSVFATCLEKCPSSLDIPAFMPVIAKALADVEDVQLQTHQIILSMCARQPIPLVAAADSFVAPLEKTVNKKKGQKTGTELERVYEWIKSGLRVMIAISKLDGAMNSRKFAEFVERINNSSKHQPFLNAVHDER